MLYTELVLSITYTIRTKLMMFNDAYVLRVSDMSAMKNPTRY